MPAAFVLKWYAEVKYERRTADEFRLDLERMRYHATDFGVTSPPEPADGAAPFLTPAPPPPPTPPAPSSPRRRWLEGLGWLGALGGWAGVTVLADFTREPARTALVRAHLAEIGFVDAEVWRVRTSRECWGGQEFYWRSEPGDGAACLRDGDYVTVRADREIWAEDPFTRPAM